MAQSKSELTDQIVAGMLIALGVPEVQDGALTKNFETFTNNWNIDLSKLLYTPSDALTSRLADYKKWRDDKLNEDAGKLMEEIVLLSFKCLKGWGSIKRYQSYAPQHDLVISGSSAFWLLLLIYLQLNIESRTIVIEAKNLDKTKASTGKINDQQFSRLCSVIQNKFEKTCDLGVFFSRYGAAGFPDDNSTRKRDLRDAQATQILFHAKTGKYVVVFDDNDILNLDKPGALPKILESKIRSVEEGTGLPLKFEDEWKEIDLPSHLSKYI